MDGIVTRILANAAAGGRADAAQAFCEALSLRCGGVMIPEWAIFVIQDLFGEMAPLFTCCVVFSTPAVWSRVGALFLCVS